MYLDNCAIYYYHGAHIKPQLLYIYCKKCAHDRPTLNLLYSEMRGNHPLKKALFRVISRYMNPTFGKLLINITPELGLDLNFLKKKLANVFFYYACSYSPTITVTCSYFPHTWVILACVRNYYFPFNYLIIIK